jgi:hypothetical protein
MFDGLELLVFEFPKMHSHDLVWKYAVKRGTSTDSIPDHYTPWNLERDVSEPRSHARLDELQPARDS